MIKIKKNSCSLQWVGCRPVPHQAKLHKAFQGLRFAPLYPQVWTCVCTYIYVYVYTAYKYKYRYIDMWRDVCI